MKVFFPFLLLLGCDTEFTTFATTCPVEIHSPRQVRASLTAQFEDVEGSSPSGEYDLLQIEGSPLTTHYDTAAYIGGQRTTVLDVDRDSCEECDDCRLAAQCNVCEDCDECDALCDSTCTETATLVIPELTPGSVSVQIYNSYGQSNSLDLVSLAGSITEPKQPLDTGLDSGPIQDSGAGDSAQAFDSGADTADVEDSKDSASPSEDGS